MRTVTWGPGFGQGLFWVLPFSRGLAFSRRSRWRVKGFFSALIRSRGSRCRPIPRRESRAFFRPFSLAVVAFRLDSSGRPLVTGSGEEEAGGTVFGGAELLPLPHGASAIIRSTTRVRSRKNDSECRFSSGPFRPAGAARSDFATAQGMGPYGNPGARSRQKGAPGRFSAKS